MLYQDTKKFPKCDRFTIGQKSCDLVLKIIEKMFLTNSKDSNKKIERLKILNSIDVKLNILKILIRLSFDTNCINQNKYIQLQEKLQEICKMNGGWIKYTRQQTPPN